MRTATETTPVVWIALLMMTVHATNAGKARRRR